MRKKLLIFGLCVLTILGVSSCGNNKEKAVSKDEIKKAFKEASELDSNAVDDGRVDINAASNDDEKLAEKKKELKKKAEEKKKSESESKSDDAEDDNTDDKSVGYDPFLSHMSKAEKEQYVKELEESEKQRNKELGRPEDYHVTEEFPDDEELTEEDEEDIDEYMFYSFQFE